MSKKKHNPVIALLQITGKSVYDLFKHLFLAIYHLFRLIFRIILKLFRGKDKKDNKKKKLNIFKRSKKPKKEICNIHHQNTVKGYFTDFRKRLDNDSLIISIVGKRGSGKSALGFSLLENIYAKTERKAFVMGVSQDILPNWVTSVEKIEDVSNGGLLLIDEGAISFSSRESMSKKNKQLGKILAVARHKDLTLIFITQNTGMMDKSILNLTDTLIFKEGSLLQERMERRAMKDFYEKSREEFNKIDKQERVAYAYIFDDGFEGVIKADLPTFWSDKISKSHKKQ